MTALVDYNSKFDTHFTRAEQNIIDSDYLIGFSGNTSVYCIGMIDMVGSTKIASILSTTKITEYYKIFLNSMAKIVGKFGGSVIKNIGDSLVYYFPKSSNTTEQFRFISCLECSMTMIENHDSICNLLKSEGLPKVDYRISLDYGTVAIMKLNHSNSLDMIGTPINMCSKINKAAKPNGIVIGGDLHFLVKKYDRYRFKEVKGFSLGFKHTYPIYSVHRF